MQSVNKIYTEHCVGHSNIYSFDRYSIILLYRSSGDHDEYFDISEFRYNRSSFVLTLCPAGLQIELRYKQNFDISEFDIAGLCCTIIVTPHTI